MTLAKNWMSKLNLPNYLSNQMKVPSTTFQPWPLLIFHFSNFQIIADYWKLRCTQRETKQLISGIIFFFLGNSETDFWPIEGQGFKNVINCPLHAIVARRNFWCNLVQVKPRNLNFFLERNWPRFSKRF